MPPSIERAFDDRNARGKMVVTASGRLPGPVAGALMEAYRPVAAYDPRRLVALARRGAG